MQSKKNLERPYSCDTFIVLPPLTESNLHIFGKNSDRPAGEVQEVIFVLKENQMELSGDVECTHIKVTEGSIKYRCVLSKPAWCWGAEMGANECGLCIGNEAVFSKIPYETRPKALTGLDIVRLCLERCETARQAVEMIGNLIEKYGQGGECFHRSANFNFGYDNSFLVADSNEAWTVETCNKVWVAKRITEGFYNMSNIYSIGDDFELESKNLRNFLTENNLWDGNGTLNFAQVCQGPSPCTDSRYKAGRHLLEEYTKERRFSPFDMISILRDDEAGICVDDRTRGVQTTSSQVSVLKCSNEKVNDTLNACHFFTGTPNPKNSLFKPFIFVEKVDFGSLTNSAINENSDDHSHALYKAHKTAAWPSVDRKILATLEEEGIREILEQFNLKDSLKQENYQSLFKDVVSTEIEMLRNA